MRAAVLFSLALGASGLVAPHARAPQRLASAVEGAEPAAAAAPPADSAVQTLDDITLAKQSTALDQLTARWDSKKDFRSWEDSRMTGFSEQAEIINGRTAMFFLVVGLLTEYWTGQSIPDQVFTMLRVGSFIGPE